MRPRDRNLVIPLSATLTNLILRFFVLWNQWTSELAILSEPSYAQFWPSSGECSRNGSLCTNSQTVLASVTIANNTFQNRNALRRHRSQNRLFTETIAMKNIAVYSRDCVPLCMVSFAFLKPFINQWPMRDCQSHKFQHIRVGIEQRR